MEPFNDPLPPENADQPAIRTNHDEDGVEATGLSSNDSSLICDGPTPFADQTEEEALDWDPKAAALDDWKAELRREFESWLEGLDEIPELKEDEKPPETPDLAMFYSQWAAANTEARKANRRTAEAFSQWGDILGRFEGDVRLLREQMQRFNQTTTPSDALARSHCLALVELLDRMQRVAHAFRVAPPASWWGGGRQWLQMWENQRAAFDIIISHLEAWLKKEGITRIETSGQPFDPTLMTAVEAVPDSARPHHTILAELAAGYRRQGDLLRPAQVKVSLNPNSNTNQ